MSGRPIPYRDLHAAMRHSLGFLDHVPGKEHVTIVACPQWHGVDHWSITRRGDDPEEPTVWTGSGWETSNLPEDQIYRWTLAEAIREHAKALADLAQEPSAWRTGHTTPEALDEEFLAEFATEASA